VGYPTAANNSLIDKIAASKKKGLWLGGNPPLGYDARGRSLVVNLAEAEIIRCIFALYEQLGCVDSVAVPTFLVWGPVTEFAVDSPLEGTSAYFGKRYIRISTLRNDGPFYPSLYLS
jgi:hypothetical protein